MPALNSGPCTQQSFQRRTAWHDLTSRPSTDGTHRLSRPDHFFGVLQQTASQRRVVHQSRWVFEHEVDLVQRARKPWSAVDFLQSRLFIRLAFQVVNGPHSLEARGSASRGRSKLERQVADAYRFDASAQGIALVTRVRDEAAFWLQIIACES